MSSLKEQAVGLMKSLHESGATFKDLNGTLSLIENALLISSICDECGNRAIDDDMIIEVHLPESDQERQMNDWLIDYANRKGQKILIVNAKKK